MYIFNVFNLDRDVLYNVKFQYYMVIKSAKINILNHAFGQKSSTVLNLW